MLLVAGAPTLAAGQAQLAASLSGRVIDAGTGAPVAQAVISLEPAGPGLITDPGSASVLTTVRTVVTGPSGSYHFAEVTVGSYRMRVERIGFRSAAAEIEVRRPIETGVSIALELQPVMLEPLNVRQRALARFVGASRTIEEMDAARLAAELDRQERFLSSDTRVLTNADVIDGVTLGEGDVFRALQRFPGVGTRDDYTAELWTRGAPWTQTRVTFDGLPLFNPVHAVGILSAFTPEVLGSVHLHTGVRPPSIGEGAAGVVDLRSRPGAGEGELRGVAGLSAASSKIVLEQRVGERGAWLVSARRSHLGVLTGGMDRIGLGPIDLPYGFHDLAARVDAGIGGVRIEASGLWEEDRLEGDVAGVIERTLARWGNTAGGVTLHSAIGGTVLTQSIGASRFMARTDERVVTTRESAPVWMEPESRNVIEYLRVAGEIGPATRTSGSRWSTGYEISRQSVEYEGSFPRYHAVKPDTMRRLDYTRTLTLGAWWGDLRVRLGERTTLDSGLRLEGGGPAVENAPAVRVSPRVALRVMLTGEQSLSVSAGRIWQHTQSIALGGPSIHPAFHATHFWLWADERTPAVRADVVNVGGERWLGGGWLASANVFLRSSRGLALPDPEPGRLGRRPLFVHGSGLARGFETGLRRIGAMWSASLGYAYGVSEIEVDGERYPSAADRRHAVDAMMGVHLGHGLRAAAAYSAMTGAPFTRAYSRSPRDCSSFGFGCDDPTGAYIEWHNAERTPGYRSLDLSLQWGRPVGPVELNAYAQVRNLLGRDNASTYAGSGPVGRIQTREGTQIVWEDRFERGLPRMPVAGLSIAF